VQLTWSAQSATSCTASGSTAWSGSEKTSDTASVVISATVTLTLTCNGPGGSAAQSVTITATPAPAKSGGGGGSMDVALLSLLGATVFWGRRRVPKARRDVVRLRGVVQLT